MRKYIVTVVKTESYSVDIEVKAKTLAQAEKLAEDQAYEKPQNWSYGETEITSFGEQIYET